MGNTPVKPVAVHRPQNSQHASRKPFAVGCLTRAHRSSARELNIGRTHITPLLPFMNSQQISSRPTGQWLPRSLAVQVASAHARVQKASATQLIFLSYLAHALGAIKLFQFQAVFGQRAILIWGIETWLGILSRTQHPIL